jgi:hypothetical protein
VDQFIEKFVTKLFGQKLDRENRTGTLISMPKKSHEREGKQTRTSDVHIKLPGHCSSGCLTGSQWYQQIGPKCLYKPDAWQDRELDFDTDMISLPEYAFLVTDGENSCTSCPSKWMTDVELERASHLLLHRLRKKVTEDKVVTAILQRRKNLQELQSELGS